MKKISIILAIALITMCNSCTGYKPIFNVSDLNFEIMDYSLKGENTIANKIYYKLNNLSKLKNAKLEKRKINLTIEVFKDKEALSKDGTGQALEYKLTLRTKIVVRDFLTNFKILDYKFNSSVGYVVQEQYSNTLKFENNSIDNLTNSIYEEVLIELTNALKTK